MILKYTANQNQLFSDFLLSLELPKKLISSMIAQNLFSVNGLLLPFYKTVNKGDVITLTLPEESIDDTIIHEDINLDIVFEDDYLMIVNKPSNMPVMVTKSHPTQTLSNALCYYFEKFHIMSKIHLVNRLDKDTSGLMIVAKNRYIKYLLSENLKHKIKREYYCVVTGVMKEKKGDINLPILKLNDDSIKRTVHPNGLEAMTSFEVISYNQHYSLLKVWLKTGRTHQIRVHLSHIGYPIVGDQLYNSLKESYDMMLFSHKIEFIHPITKELIVFDKEIPQSFQAILR